MTEQELRALVREAIALYVGSHIGPAAVSQPGAFRAHPSHAQFDVPAGADTQDPCVIEPSVSCTHCGYCRSYGD